MKCLQCLSVRPVQNRVKHYSKATFNETIVHVHVFTLYKDTNGRPTLIFLSFSFVFFNS